MFSRSIIKMIPWKTDREFYFTTTSPLLILFSSALQWCRCAETLSLAHLTVWWTWQSSCISACCRRFWLPPGAACCGKGSGSREFLCKLTGVTVGGRGCKHQARSFTKNLFWTCYQTLDGGVCFEHLHDVTSPFSPERVRVQLKVGDDPVVLK